MKKKLSVRILSGILSLLIFLSLPPIAVFADPGIKAEPDATLPEGIADFINPEEYIANAGKPGYDEMKLIGISAPEFVVCEDEGNAGTEICQYWFRLYLYNPNLESFCVRGDPFTGSGIGTLTYRDNRNDSYRPHMVFPQNEDLPEDVDPNSYEDILIENRLFLAVSTVGTFPLSDTPIVDVYYDLETLTLNLADGGYAEFAVGQTFRFKNIDNELLLSSPLQDLATYFDTTVSVIKASYPKSATAPISQIFVHDTEEYLYLYLYDGNAKENPPYKRMNVTMRSGGEKYPFVFDTVGAEETVVKARCKLDTAASGKTLSSLLTEGAFGICEVRYLTKDRITRICVENTIYAFGTTVEDGKTVRTVSADTGEIRLVDVGTTFYRLDSSAKGAGWYSTLETVYFSIPSACFETASEDVLNHRWIESITGNYSCSYTNGVIMQYKSYPYNTLMKSPSKFNFATNYIPNNMGMGVESCDFGIGKEAMKIYLNRYGVYPSWNLFFVRYDDFGESFQELISRKDLEQAIANTDDPFSEEFQQVNFRIDKDTAQALLSRGDDGRSFLQAAAEYGFFNTVWRRVFGDNAADSIKNIPAFVSLSGEDLKEAYRLSDTALCTRYYVAQEDAAEIKAKMKQAYASDEVFTLFRFDTYDYYASADVSFWDAFVRHKTSDMILFREKYYRDFNVLQMDLRNHYDTKVYTVSMDPLSFVGGGIYRPAPTPAETVAGTIRDAVETAAKKISFPTFAGEEKTSVLKELAGVFLPILSVSLVLVLVLVFREPITALVKMISEWIQTGIRRLKNRKKK